MATGHLHQLGRATGRGGGGDVLGRLAERHGVVVAGVHAPDRYVERQVLARVDVGVAGTGRVTQEPPDRAVAEPFTVGSNQVEHVTAEGAVRIRTPSQTAYGDRAEYDQAKRLLVLTGAALKLESADQTVTARDAFEYWQDQDALVAKGDVAILKNDGTRIDGDQVTSYDSRSSMSLPQVVEISVVQLDSTAATRVTPSMQAGLVALINECSDAGDFVNRLRDTPEFTSLISGTHSMSASVR